MRGLLFVVVVVALGAVGLGFYLGWFHVESDHADGKSNVTLTVDKDKFEADKKTAVADVQGMGRQTTDKTAGPNEKSHDGKAVSITADKIMMTTMEGAEEPAYTLAAGTKVTCDGKVCKAADLKPGMRIRVTTKNAEPHVATRIEALDSNRDFEKGAHIN